MEYLKIKYSFDERIKYVNKILTKHPDHVPVVIEKCNKDKTTPDIDKNKYIIPRSLNISEFIFIIRKRIKIDSNKAIFIFINNLLIPMNTTVGSVYDEHKENDSILYVKYSSENTFG